MAKSKSLGKQNDVKTKNDLTHLDANDGDSDDEHVKLLSTSRLGKITDNIINKKHDVQLHPVVDTSKKGQKLQRNNAAGSTSRKSASPSRTAAPPPPPPPAPIARKKCLN
ncbi:hypothetical protein niasHT_017436 [Heterodera trifolii]|uniref:Uncharacterized protein n=1 Tax=Heterodera trifolii TaxID=157864 RepID=A0ABD2LK26_9BILA